MPEFESYGLQSLFQDHSDSNAMADNANLFSRGGKGAEAIVEQGESNVRRVGRTNQTRARDGLFPGMDRKRALARPVDVFFTSDSVMSDADAGAFTLRILARCEVTGADDSVMVAFIKAMCLCMAANSASVLVPGRSKFWVADSEFDFFTDVMVVLGNDARRYFRAYADVTRDYLKALILEFQSGPVGDGEEAYLRYERVMDMYEAVHRVAENRGLTRVLYLVHDSAEFCSAKTAVERAYLMQSKETIFANGAYRNNMVDHPMVNQSRASRPPGAVATHASHDSMPDGF